MALRNHMITKPNEIGGISASPEIRRLLAERSQTWSCPICGVNHSFLKTGLGAQSNEVIGEKQKSLRMKDLKRGGVKRSRGKKEGLVFSLLSRSSQQIMQLFVPLLVILFLQFLKTSNILSTRM